MLFDYEPFIGGSIRSVLALVDDQEVKDHLLWDAIYQIYQAAQCIFLPYPLPFGQAHCLCCKWSHPFSSARALLLPPCRTLFTTYITIGDRPTRSDMRYLLFDNNTGPLQCSVFTIQPGWKSIYCGLDTGYDSSVLQSMLFLTLPSRHTNYVECKPTLFCSSSVFSSTNFNIVTQVHWHVSVLYRGPYDISGTFMADDATDNAGSPNFIDDFYLHLSMELTDDRVPFVSYSVSRAFDSSLPLSNDEMTELGISVNIEPLYIYCQPSVNS
jgi:hypothetical protein